jgi:tetratricopeptide (TPR) repeat protein
MNNSGFIYKDTKRTNTAKGFMVNPDGTIESTYERMPNVPTPAGGMFSTAEDLLKLDRSLMNDNVLLNDEHKVLLLNRFNTDIKLSFAELLAKPDFGMGIAGGSPGWNAIYDQNVGNKYTVIILSNFDNGAEALIDRINSVLKEEKYPPLKMSAGRFVYEKIKEKGSEDFAVNYKEYLSGYTIEDDGMLNRMGYQFLNKGMMDEAIAVFIINTKYFPDIANTYDSLGEAYMLKGEKKLALENYKKSLVLNPQNKNAEMRINELKEE